MGAWKNEDDARLRELYPAHTAAEMAAATGRTVSAVRNRCMFLGLKEKHKAWGAEEVVRLRAAYASAGALALDLDALAAEFGRSRDGVCQKAAELGLTKLTRRKSTRIPLKVMAFATDAEARRAVAGWIKVHFATRGHPRGMLGKRHTPAVRETVGAKARRMWSDPAAAVNSPDHRRRQAERVRAMHRAGKFTAKNTYSRCRRGMRADLGIFVRSSWEANYARYLNVLMARGEIFFWEYEPEHFEFPPSGSDPVVYTPDFRVWFCEGRHEWHEVKGWLTQHGAAAIHRMRECRPSEVLVVRDGEWFRQANRSGLAAQVPGWER